MLSKTIFESDRFLDLPFSTQTLYTMLSLKADDDGFVDNPKTVMRMVSCTEEDLDTLIQNGFIIRFESDVIVITHWNVNNHIQKDRYKPTIHQKEYAKLELLENKMYSVSKSNTNCIQNVNITDTQISIDKDSKDKDSIDKLSEMEQDVSIESDFELLWSLYPRKEGKEIALKEFKQAIKGGVSFDLMKQKIEEYSQQIKAKQTDSQYIKKFSNWLLGKGWQDTYDLTPKKTENNSIKGDYLERDDDDDTFNDEVLMDL